MPIPTLHSHFHLPSFIISDLCISPSSDDCKLIELKEDSISVIDFNQHLASSQPSMYIFSSGGRQSKKIWMACLLIQWLLPPNFFFRGFLIQYTTNSLSLVLWLQIPILGWFSQICIFTLTCTLSYRMLYPLRCLIPNSNAIYPESKRSDRLREKYLGRAVGAPQPRSQLVTKAMLEMKTAEASCLFPWSVRSQVWA